MIYKAPKSQKESGRIILSAARWTILLCDKPPRTNQPGHPSVDR